MAPGPIDVDARRERPRQRQEDLVGPTLVTAERAQRRRGRARLIDALLDPRRQHGMGADLDEHPIPGAQHDIDHVREPDRLPQVGDPVRGVELGGPGAGDSGIERHVATGRSDPGQRFGQLIGYLIHRGTVGGVVHIDHPGVQPPLSGVGHHGPHLLGRA
jgi:hypothetical protein